MAKKKKSNASRAKNSAKRPSSQDGKSASDVSTWRTVFEWTKSICIAIALALLIRWPIAEPFKIPSGSMEPTFFDGDRIFVNKHAYGLRFPMNGFRIPWTRTTTWYTDKWLWKGASPERWDIVVFKSAEHRVEHDTLVKRVVGLAGERVQIRDGKLFINGEPVEPPDSMPDVEYGQAFNSFGFGLIPDDEHTIVPEGHVFLLGDNSDHSRDGRWFGWVPEYHILGRVTSIWYPFSRWRDFTGFTGSLWWRGGFSLLGLWTLIRLFVGRSVGVYGDGLIGLLRRGEHIFIRFALGLPIPFTRKRIGRGAGLKRGQVVLYRPPSTDAKLPELLLGVVAALPDECVAFEDGRLTIDGTAVRDPEVFTEARFSARGHAGKYGVSKSKEYSRVPSDHYFILSDSDSEWPDSRILGWVARDRIVGSARWVWWPLTRWRRVGKTRPNVL